jgi:hypothetical protein
VTVEVSALGPGPASGPSIHVPLFQAVETNPETGTPPPRSNSNAPEVLQFFKIVHPRKRDAEYAGGIHYIDLISNRFFFLAGRI